jgi:hypothetical protein
LVLAILFAGSGLAAVGDLHHGGESCEALAPATVVTTCLDHEHPPGVEHVESAPAAESRLCPACLLRTHSAGLDFPAPARLDAPAPSVGAVSLPASPARSALLERSAAPRGPPTSSVV